MTFDLGRHYLDDTIVQFHRVKQQAERAMAQVSDEQLFVALDPEANSIATIVKHIAGNLRSRWTEFLTTDGEKADRHRDREFVVDADDTRPALVAAWESGWRCLFDALAALQPADLGRSVTIRGEPHTVVEAIHRQLAHQSYHSGQIVFLAKHFLSERWQTLTIPRGKSAEFNVRMERQFGDTRQL